MKKQLQSAFDILSTLKKSGYDAYIVGGYVRDHVLDIPSNDIDITTSATPDEVLSLFKRVKETGKKYGTVTVFLNEYQFEVTTFRTDGEYQDNRRPSTVTYSQSIYDDLVRRDFTMNALIMDESLEVRDYFLGLDDIKHKLIRTIENPTNRFQEDALRILRAFRFVSKLGFDIEPNTLAAIETEKDLIETIAIERVMIELEKIFEGPYYQKAIQLMIDTGVSFKLYGLHLGLLKLTTLDQPITKVEGFIIAFIYGEWSPKWRFSNKVYRLINQILDLHEVTKEDVFNPFIVFSNELEPCLLANRINVLLGYHDQEKLIRNIDDNLLVKDVCDLKFKGQDILELTTLKKRSIIALVIDDLLFNVIMKIMPNDYDILKEFALKRVAELQNEMGELDE